MAQKILTNGMERSLFRQYINDNFQELYAGGTGGGTTGKDGSTWYSGAEEPPGIELGKDGDYYVNINTNGVYQKQDGIWNYLMYLKGDNGAPGEKGKDGSVWYTGKGVPDNMIGVTGDFYLDGDNGNVYQRTPIEWIYQTNIKGPAGTGGTGGGGATSILTGEGLPGATMSANENDYYIDNKSGDLYRYEDDGMMVGNLVWNMRGNIGTGGSNIEPVIETNWHSDGTLVTTIGKDGDYFIDKSTMDVFINIKGSWALLVNNDGNPSYIDIETPGNFQFYTIYSGEGFPESTIGEYGNYYIDILTSDLYFKDSYTESYVFRRELKKETIVDNKAVGSLDVGVLAGRGNPTDNNTIGLEKQYYLDLGDGTLYRMLGGVWVTYSSKIYTHNGDPYSNMMIAEVGSHYIDGNNGDLFRCDGVNQSDSSANWQYIGNISIDAQNKINRYNISSLATNKEFTGDTMDVEVIESIGKLAPVCITSTGYKKASADTMGGNNYPAVGLTTYKLIEQGMVDILIRGFVYNTLEDWNFTKGDLIYLATDGGVTNVKPAVQGEVVQCLGYAVEPNKIYFNPSMHFEIV